MDSRSRQTGNVCMRHGQKGEAWCTNEAEIALGKEKQSQRQRDDRQITERLTRNRITETKMRHRWLYLITEGRMLTEAKECERQLGGK